MEVQLIVVSAIIILAVGFTGKTVLGKLKSDASDSSCSSDCGCGK